MCTAAQRWLLVVFLGLVLPACQAERKPPVTTPAPPPAVSPAPVAQPASAASLPNDIKWVQRSAEYYAAMLETYRHATVRVEEQAATRKAGTWAVILDA